MTESEPPTPDLAPALPGGAAVGSVGVPASPGATHVASASGEELSPLERARNTLIDSDGSIDLTPIHDFVGALPRRLAVSAELNKVLDDLEAILFHILFRTRTRVAEDWLTQQRPHSIETKPRRERPSTDDLLAQL